MKFKKVLLNIFSINNNIRVSCNWRGPDDRCYTLGIDLLEFLIFALNSTIL